MNEKIAWLEENSEAEAEELKAQKKEMEDIIQPIIAKLYQVTLREVASVCIILFLTKFYHCRFFVLL